MISPRAQAVQAAAEYYGSRSSLARRAGVAVMTVSRICRGETGYISEPVWRRLLPYVSRWYDAASENEPTDLANTLEARKLLEIYRQLDHTRQRELLSVARELAADQITDQ